MVLLLWWNPDRCRCLGIVGKARFWSPRLVLRSVMPLLCVMEITVTFSQGAWEDSRTEQAESHGAGGSHPHGPGVYSP